MSLLGDDFASIDLEDYSHISSSQDNDENSHNTSKDSITPRGKQSKEEQQDQKRKKQRDESIEEIRLGLTIAYRAVSRASFLLFQDLLLNGPDLRIEAGDNHEHQHLQNNKNKSYRDSDEKVNDKKDLKTRQNLTIDTAQNVVESPMLETTFGTKKTATAAETPSSMTNATCDWKEGRDPLLSARTEAASHQYHHHLSPEEEDHYTCYSNNRLNGQAWEADNRNPVMDDQQQDPKLGRVGDGDDPREEAEDNFVNEGTTPQRYHPQEDNNINDGSRKDVWQVFYSEQHQRDFYVDPTGQTVSWYAPSVVMQSQQTVKDLTDDSIREAVEELSCPYSPCSQEQDDAILFSFNGYGERRVSINRFSILAVLMIMALSVQAWNFLGSFRVDERNGIVLETTTSTKLMMKNTNPHLSLEQEDPKNKDEAQTQFVERVDERINDEVNTKTNAAHQQEGTSTIFIKSNMQASLSKDNEGFITTDQNEGFITTDQKKQKDVDASSKSDEIPEKLELMHVSRTSQQDQPGNNKPTLSLSSQVKEKVADFYPDQTPAYKDHGDDEQCFSNSLFESHVILPAQLTQSLTKHAHFGERADMILHRLEMEMHLQQSDDSTSLCNLPMAHRLFPKRCKLSYLLHELH